MYLAIQCILNQFIKEIRIFIHSCHLTWSHRLLACIFCVKYNDYRLTESCLCIWRLILGIVSSHVFRVRISFLYSLNQTTENILAVVCDKGPMQSFNLRPHEKLNKDKWITFIVILCMNSATINIYSLQEYVCKTNAHTDFQLIIGHYKLCIRIQDYVFTLNLR